MFHTGDRVRIEEREDLGEGVVLSHIGEDVLIQFPHSRLSINGSFVYPASYRKDAK